MGCEFDKYERKNSIKMNERQKVILRFKDKVYEIYYLKNQDCEGLIIKIG